MQAICHHVVFHLVERQNIEEISSDLLADGGKREKG
jgi:hypothetical protein